jgi:TolB-like protein
MLLILRRALRYCLILSSISCSSITALSPYGSDETHLVSQRDNRLIGIKNPNRNLNDYVQTLTHELVSNMIHVKPQSVLAASSFVFVDSDFLSMPTFAKQIQESFTYEFHKVGQPIIEFKSTGFIRILPEGDFALSNDYSELKKIQPIDYILMGTLTELRDGIQVNAKVVGVKSHAVVAAAQIIIPREVTDNVIPTTKKGQSIKLIE